MAFYRPPALDKNTPIIEPQTGRITPYFQRFWQNLTFVAADSATGAVDAVKRSTFASWSSPTGTASRAAFATYTAPTISAVPTQAEVQAIADALQAISRATKALVDDLKT